MSRMSKKDKQQQEEILEACKDAALAEDAPETAEEVSPDIDVQALQAAADDAKAKADEYLTLAQRVQADFDNFRRRNESVRKDAYEDGARAFATTLLPVMDNLERAMDAAKESPDAGLKDGVGMVLRQLNEAFEKRGIKPIDRLGEKFDPNLENALMQGTSDEGEPGTVCQVFQKGYEMNNFVLRHAMVKVVPD